jgi:uncharacterized protein
MSKINKELRYIPAHELRVQTSPTGSKVLEGRAIVYNSKSQDLGGFIEVVAPGSVTASLRDNPDVLCLRDHNPSILLARTKSKTLTLTEDAQGLTFRCELPDTSQAADLVASIERGDLDGVSFGFKTVEDKWTNDGETLVRTLLKINLYEISPCSFPAYGDTSVSTRSCPIEFRSLLSATDEEDEIASVDCGCDCEDCLDGDHCEGDDCDYEEDSVRNLLLRLTVAKRLL